MLCYRDTTFCTESSCNKWDTCGRAYTQTIAVAAEYWWSKSGGNKNEVPVCFFVDKPSCYEERKQSDNKLLNTDLLPCPFCGITPELGGMMFTRGDRFKQVQQVRHPITGKCPLDMLLFRSNEWQERVCP